METNPAYGEVGQFHCWYNMSEKKKYIYETIDSDVVIINIMSQIPILSQLGPSTSFE